MASGFLGTSGTLLDYKDLSDRFQLPRWMHFQCWQLRHAARAQFVGQIAVTMDPIEELLAQESLSKPLSSLYFSLLSLESPKLERLWEAWNNDIPTLEREDWNKCFEDSLGLVISSRDKFIQTKFLHRVNYTPQRLHRLFPQRDPFCSRWRMQTGTYFHIFWSCPKVARFWAAFFEVINECLQLSLVSPELDLLGIQEVDQRPRYTKLLLSYLLYYAKRVILLKWNSPFPPSMTLWETSINKALPRYKMTYLNRKCPIKFDGIWLPWTA